MKKITIVIIMFLIAIFGIGIYLVIKDDKDTNNNTEKKDEAIEEETETSASNLSDIEGYWFTPHAALRNVTFANDNKFTLNEWEDEIYTGSFEFDGAEVVFKFDNTTKKDLVLTLSKDDNASYLINENEGEHFVKQ